MDIKAKNKAFIKALKETTKDRGNCAALRRYWSPTTQCRAYPILGKLGALKNEPKTILAALYAEHTKRGDFEVDKPKQCIGKAARQIGKDKLKKDKNHPYEAQFRRLLACNSFEDLSQQLHYLVKRLEQEQIGLDYEQLLINLYTWRKEDEPQKREKVKTDWAADFWQAPLITTDQEGAET